MPSAPPRYCNACRGSHVGVCATRRRHEKRHHSGPGVNYGRKWGKARLGFLVEHPLCVDCAPAPVPATEVDHIVPHRGDRDLFWDVNNWAGRCKSHHSAKTRREQVEG
jgi:5-methylcytosine-specific restriction protein A